MIKIKKNNFYFLFFLFLYAPANCMDTALTQAHTQGNWHLLPQNLLLQKIMPLLNFKARNSLGKSCKAYYKAIKPKKLRLTINECKQLDIDMYTNAMIYYARIANKEALVYITENTTDENRRTTRGISHSDGWTRIYPFCSSSLIEIYGEKRVKKIEKPQSLVGHFVARAGNVAGLRFFLKLNNNPNIKDNDEQTPLHWIVSEKDESPAFFNTNNHKPENLISTLKLLLMHPTIEVNTQDNLGNTPLHYAANFKLVDHLLHLKQISLDIKNIQGETPFFYSLHQAGISTIYRFRDTQATYDNYQFECLLNDPRTDINTQNNKGETPLHYVIQSPCPMRSQILLYDTIKRDRLLTHPNINVNIQNKKGETPLHYAVRGNQEKTPLYDVVRDQIFTRENVKLLLQRPEININLQNKDGETALVYAIKANDIEVILLLCEYANRENRGNVPKNKNLNVNTIDKYGYTPLDYAIKTHNQKVFELLIKSGATYESFFHKHQTVMVTYSLVSLIGILTGILAYVQQS